MKKYTLSYIFICVCLTGWFSTCSNMNKLGKQTSIGKAVTDNVVLKPPVPFTIVKHDTITVRKMTPEQYQAYLQQFYKSNFDKLLQPEFNRLNGVITKQAQSLQVQSTTINGLSTILSNMRARSIHRTDSMQYVNDNLRYAFDAFKKQVADNEKEQVKQNQDQIKKLNSITNFLLYGFISLWGIFILAATSFYFWFKKLKSNINRVNYV